jgi:hypothetical protein
MFPVNLCILSELKSESVSEINRNSVRIEIGIGVRNEPEQSKTNKIVLTLSFEQGIITSFLIEGL